MRLFPVELGRRAVFTLIVGSSPLPQPWAVPWFSSWSSCSQGPQQAPRWVATFEVACGERTVECCLLQSCLLQSCFPDTCKEPSKFWVVDLDDLNKSQCVELDKAWA